MIDHLFTEQEIKRKLIESIAEKILEYNLVEFTKTEEMENGATTFRARAFLLPDSMVKTLRVEKFIE